MGDRANICVREKFEKRDFEVFLYGHWAGDYYCEAAERALLKYPNRQDDPAYLARIIFEELIPKSEKGSETGFGISNKIEDNNNPVCVVDCMKKSVYFETEREAKLTEELPFKEITVGSIKKLFSSIVE